MDTTQHKPGLHYATLGHGPNTYLVQPTGDETLGPVTLSVRYGVFSFQDYLTAEAADLLADALREVAQAVRHAS